MRLDLLQKGISRCERCVQSRISRPPVPPEGRITARIMAVGEAPGRNETLLGRPFAGAAGLLLDGFLAAAGLSRGDLFITNTVRCRPVAQGKRGDINRPPSKTEIENCSDWLEKEIKLISPRLILSLGAIPLRLLTDSDTAVSSSRGLRTTCERFGGLPLFSLYHPAAVIYDSSKKAAYAADMLALAGYIKEQEFLRQKFPGQDNPHERSALPL